MFKIKIDEATYHRKLKYSYCFIVILHVFSNIKKHQVFDNLFDLYHKLVQVLLHCIRL